MGQPINDRCVRDAFELLRGFGFAMLHHSCSASTTFKFFVDPCRPCQYDRARYGLNPVMVARSPLHVIQGVFFPKRLLRSSPSPQAFIFVESGGSGELAPSLLLQR